MNYNYIHKVNVILNIMSKKYRYLAQKRDSYNNYMVTIYLCKKYMPNNYITCKTCLSRAGETNRIQGFVL